MGLSLMVATPGWRSRGAVLAGGGLVAVPLFAAVMAWEGWPYVAEGQRFLVGHTTLWGQTLWSEAPLAQTWFQTLQQAPLGLLWAPMIAAGCLVVLVRGQRDIMLAVGLLAAVIWTGSMQNPANPRHLAPVLFLALLVLACLPSVVPRRWALLSLLAVLAVQGMALAMSLRGFSAGPPPLVQAAKALPLNALLITNPGVATLRQSVPTVRIIDAVYAADAASVVRTWSGGPVLWLRSTPLTQAQDWTLKATFAARTWGEPSLWLYQRSPLAGPARAEANTPY
jgi:hypothetical protein